MQTIYNKLKRYGESDFYPLHMPGHKRRLGALPEVRGIDITEIDGFDNLHHAQGILLDAQKRAAGLYGSEETFYLVNGSTAGILAAISACTAYGGKLLMARNCHKAAYHAAELRGLQTVYVYPRKTSRTEQQAQGGADAAWSVGGDIDPREVEAALAADSQIQAVFITSPTYEGIVSDVRAIAGIAHKYGKPLIVDEAHGAHFGFHSLFPQSSVRQGADIVIHSVHKTLPSLTQTALLHRNGALTDRKRIQNYLDIYQTSSPSYVLMASIDNCVKLIKEEGATLFEQFAGYLEDFYLEAQKLRRLCVWPWRANERTGATEGAAGEVWRDPSKIVVSAPGHGGKWLAQKLRTEYHLEAEMEAGEYVVLLTSIADTREGFIRLMRALSEIDEKLRRETQGPMPEVAAGRGQKKREKGKDTASADTADTTLADTADRAVADTTLNDAADRPIARITLAEAAQHPHETVRLSESAGRISGEYLYLYPPGIPLLAPGEQIPADYPQRLEKLRDDGYELQGLKDYSGTQIDVCKEGIFNI